MALLIPRRRWLGLLVMVGLTLPLVSAPFLPSQTVSRQENRRLALAPDWPRRPADLEALPRAVDAFAGDHFAFREALISASAALDVATHGVWSPRNSPNDGVTAAEGADGQLFLVDGLERSTGRSSDVRVVDGYATWACAFASRMKARNVKVLSGLAPSPAAIIPEAAPAFARPARQPTDHDRILARLQACGVSTLDLRAPLRAAKARGRVYRRIDTHWTEFGALVAYNATMQALGRPDWAEPERSASWRPEQRSGDLARMLGRPGELEDVRTLALAPLHADVRPVEFKGLRYLAGGQALPPYGFDAGHAGARILIVGDSYTRDEFFMPLLARKAAFSAWVHMDHCGFDQGIIDAVRPDYVLLLPAERMAFCG